MSGLALILLAFAIAWIVKTRWRRYRPPSLPLPPGPKPLPIIGNVLDMPTLIPWVKYHEWCNVYSASVHSSLPGEELTQLLLQNPMLSTPIFLFSQPCFWGRTKQRSTFWTNGLSSTLIALRLLCSSCQGSPFFPLHFTDATSTIG